MSDAAIARVERALKAIAQGEMVILLDAEERENEGDLVMAADKVTPEAINFMATHGRGLICLTLTPERIETLGIPMMVDSNTSPFGTAFTVSIEAAEGVTTGISAADRARTVQAAVAPGATRHDIVMPGHIFPLRAREGGVLVRTGQTEGSVDLARLAGCEPSGVICEIMNPDGTMARLDDLERFAEEHNMVLISVSDIITYRLQRESLLEVVEESTLNTEYPGDWKVRVYRSRVDEAEHLCFICGEPDADTPTPVRVQPRIDGFDLFLQERSESAHLIGDCMQAIGEAGTGVIVYLDKPGSRASDLVRRYVHKAATELSEEERAKQINQPRQILRSLGIGAQILRDAGCGKVEVMTNRPKTIIGSDGFGIEIVNQIPIPQRSA
ncbi:3,4-dihydroxy-2-butanone-4-phosphate synthase [Lujinxingia litoralis]|uniref:3,4-dihydroxy-2-butanone 4-phosphate synthase n=1 Tax=Lujinxingia litoralis TaxID=2211119 RepID=A0A328C8E0_9DELT|nr:3,4-dihydroxy-2-butanone-4-phosphate synthase [Lujinxingia litoralis]RAL24695.1 3,4-dihydroxy-2-butanone-4-phosphate synthase [Lujinxingia litoralis]